MVLGVTQNYHSFSLSFSVFKSLNLVYFLNRTLPVNKVHCAKLKLILVEENSDTTWTKICSGTLRHLHIILYVPVLLVCNSFFVIISYISNCWIGDVRILDSFHMDQLGQSRTNTPLSIGGSEITCSYYPKLETSRQAFF